MAHASTSRIMVQVLVALVPGTITLTWFFGIGILINVVIAVLAAVALEVLALRARRRPLAGLSDWSAVVTGALIGLSLPPWLPIWTIVIGCLFAIVFARQVYGGVGQNLFNPAMVGYAVLIIAFPLTMSTWPEPGSLAPEIRVIQMKLGAPVADAMTMATPLDTFKFRGALTVQEIWTADNGFGRLSGIGWQWINAGFLLGGLYLLYRRVCGWLAPLGMLGTLVILSALFYDGGSATSLGSPLFHLFSGATMMAAFFVVTDPVTSPDSEWGQALFGIGVGGLVFLIRSIGAYPDGIAFAVLLMNAASPLIDHIQLRAA